MNAKDQLQRQMKRALKASSEPKDSFTHDQLLVALSTVWQLPLSALSPVELRQLYQADDLTDILALFTDFGMLRLNLGINPVLH